MDNCEILRTNEFYTTVSSSSFSSEVFGHVWLYFRFAVSYREGIVRLNVGHAQRFLPALGIITSQFRGRHLYKASSYRAVMNRDSPHRKRRLTSMGIIN